MFKVDDNEYVNNSGNRANETVVNLSKNNKSRNSTYMPNIEATKKLTFSIFNAQKTFQYLKQAFIKALIF